MPKIHQNMSVISQTINKIENILKKKIMKSYVNQLEFSEEGNEVELGLVCINIRDSTTTNLPSI